MGRFEGILRGFRIFLGGEGGEGIGSVGGFFVEGLGLEGQKRI